MTNRIPWRPIAAIVIVAATLIVFIQYFINHPEVWQQLRQTNPWVIAALFSLYIVFMGSLALINIGTLKLCNTAIQASESILLSMYSSVINFFGPLQSGPAFRAAYLKQKHNVALTDYTAATVVYYLCYAALSAVCLFSGILGWWLIPIGLVLLLTFIRLRKTNSPTLSKLRTIALANWHYLAFATAAQIFILILIYFIELRSIAPATSLSQAIIYTGAANFALFISITPGAIGFREAFLLLTQRLHGIDSSTIIAANTLDRSVYIVFLVIVAVCIFGTHASRRFTLSSPKK